MRIVVCDVGLGNLRSVEHALREAARETKDEIEVTRDAARAATADKLVMPGQGGFGDCARALSGPMGDAARAHIAAERPYFGICLGLQVLFESSEEAPGQAGLGVFRGHVARLKPGIDATTGGPLKIPHIGWNVADPGASGHAWIPEPAHFYFVHSYVVVPNDASIVAANTEYGASFVSAIARGNLFACQFHPEKSQQVGLRLLERFLRS
jgi:glutamine amidotransferase